MLKTIAFNQDRLGTNARARCKKALFLQGVEYQAVISQAEAELVRRKQKRQQQQQRCFPPTVF